MKTSHWRSSPENPVITSGDCHLWLAWLDEEDPASFRKVLSKDEMLRAERYRSPRAADRFTTARGILRTLLGGYQHCSPERLVFSYGPQGKPKLADEQPDGISFNMSHSEGLAVYAIVQGSEVGVDIEEFHPINDLEATASIFLSADELSEFKAVPSAEKLERFFNLWTSREAILKAQGTGFTTPARDIITKFQYNNLPASAQTGLMESNRFTMFTPAEGFRGALAFYNNGSRKIHEE
jgi:4'-phosphopantetheinyl transferase